MSHANNWQFLHVETSLWPTGVGRQRHCSPALEAELNKPVPCCQPQKATVTKDPSSSKVSTQKSRWVPALCLVLPSASTSFSFCQNTNPWNQYFWKYSMECSGCDEALGWCWWWEDSGSKWAWEMLLKIYEQIIISKFLRNPTVRNDIILFISVVLNIFLSYNPYYCPVKHFFIHDWVV